MTLLRMDHIAAVRVDPGISLELDFDSAPSEGDLAEAAALLKALSEFDERLCVTWPEESFCTRTAPTLDVEHTDVPKARVFAEEWNGAP